MEKAEPRYCMGKLELLNPRRRPVRPVTDDLGGSKANDDIPMSPEVLPECSEEESGRDRSKVDRGEGQN